MGKLIVFEGIDGCGKTTQIKLLQNWLIENGQEVVLTKWFSGKFAQPVLAALNRAEFANPVTGSHIIATDFLWRVESIIIPALQAGKTVLCDRYYFTSLARHVVRGLPEEYLRQFYCNVPTPDIVFYFALDPEAACQRKEQDGFGFFEAGVDLYSGLPIPAALERYERGLFSCEDLREGFLRFQRQVKARYENLCEYPDFCLVDARLSVEEIFQLICKKCVDRVSVCV